MSINDMEEMIDKMRVIKNKKFEKDNPNNPFKKMENLENNIDFDDDLDSIK